MHFYRAGRVTGHCPVLFLIFAENFHRMTEVTCAIIQKDGLILAAQRSESMSLPLKWEFPGGKIEKGETAESCLWRELREELNIEVEIIKKLEPVEYRYNFASIRLIPFVVNYVSGEVILSEHKAFRWLRRHELSALDWAPADVPVANSAAAFSCCPSADGSAAE